LNVTDTQLVEPCAPGDQPNIGYEKCFASITAPDVGACQVLIVLASGFDSGGDSGGKL